MELTLEEIKRIRQATKKVNKPECSGGFSIYTCPICNKRVVINDAKQWTYKRYLSKANTGSQIYMCSYPCVRKYDYAYNRI